MSNMIKLIDDGKLKRVQFYELSISQTTTKQNILDRLTLLKKAQNNQVIVMVFFIILVSMIFRLKI